METLFIYLIKVNSALIVFYLLYLVFLRKDTFIRLKRHYFLATILFSLAYPFFTVSELGNWAALFQQKQVQFETFVEVGEMQMVVLDDEPENTAKPIPWKPILIWAAIGGSLMLVLRLLWQLASIIGIKIRSRKLSLFGISFYGLSENITPFSFFGWIFLNPLTHSETELQQILTHEQTHVKQWHSVDIILAEWLCLLFWWNPAVWLLKREIAINLEYLADNGVLRAGVNSKEYQYHLLRLTYHETAVQIVNNFNVSQLKQRIMMMNKSKSPTRKLAKYLMMFPLIFLLITANSMYARATEPLDTESVNPEPLDTQEFSLQDQKPKKISKNDEVLNMVDKIPKFVGGDNARTKYLNENINYPVEAQKNGIQGRVILNFVVEKDGSLTDLKVVRGVDPLLDSEAVRVIENMPKWIPGEHKGEIVRVRFTLPITFRLQGGNKNDTAKISITDVKELSKDEKMAIVRDATSTILGKEKTFTIVENQPEFHGGDAARTKFLNENIKYPADAAKDKIQGRVICNFVVEADGSISEVNVVRGIHPSLDKEAVRVIESMPKWIPGKQRGQAVRVRFTLPITFGLHEKEKNELVKITVSDVKDNTDSKTEEDIFTVVDKQPSFVGGEKAQTKYLNENIVYPRIAQENGIQGIVIVNFIVEKDGNLTDFNVVRGIDPSLDKAALDVVRGMPKWIPGEQKGKIVRVKYTLPITFRLEK